MNGSKVFSGILTAVMVIECLLIVVTAGLVYHEITYDYSWYEDEESLLYEIEDERYGWLLCDYYSNMYGGYRASDTMEECYGVAKYYEAALWYKAYQNVGDTARSAIYADKMAQALEQMGDYQFLDGKIREKLKMK